MSSKNDKRKKMNRNDGRKDESSICGTRNQTMVTSAKEKGNAVQFTCPDEPEEGRVKVLLLNFLW